MIKKSSHFHKRDIPDQLKLKINSGNHKTLMSKLATIFLIMMFATVLPLLNYMTKYYSIHRSLIMGPVILFFTVFFLGLDYNTEIIPNPIITIRSVLTGISLWLLAITFFHIMKTGSFISALMYIYMNIGLMDMQFSLYPFYLIVVYIFLQEIISIYLTEVNGVNCFDESEIFYAIVDTPKLVFLALIMIPLFYIFLKKKIINSFCVSFTILFATIFDFLNYIVSLEQKFLDYNFYIIYVLLIAVTSGSLFFLFRCRHDKRIFICLMAFCIDYILYLTTPSNIFQKKTIEMHLKPIYLILITPVIFLLILKCLEIMRTISRERVRAVI